jgi:predicted phage baseplate assembly protein
VIQFGDGQTGAQVPTGRGNIAATYRAGAGVAGRVRAGTLTSALDRPPGLKSVTNPLPAHGGADPEQIANARDNAPRTVRTFGRAVSLEDFEDLVRDGGLVAKACATWVWDGYSRAVHLTVAGQEAAAFTDDDLRTLAASLAQASQPGYRVRLADYAALPILAGGTITVDADYVQADVLAAVRSAVLESLSFDALELGQSVHLSEVYRVIQSVAGVVSADMSVFQPKRVADRDRPNVDLLPDGTPNPLQPHVWVFPARPDPLHPGVVLPAELATIEDPDVDLEIAADGGLSS